MLPFLVPVLLTIDCCMGLFLCLQVFVGVINEVIATRNDGVTLNESKPYSGGIGGPCEVRSHHTRC